MPDCSPATLPQPAHVSHTPLPIVVRIHACNPRNEEINPKRFHSVVIEMSDHVSVGGAVTGVGWGSCAMDWDTHLHQRFLIEVLDRCYRIILHLGLKDSNGEQVFEFFHHSYTFHEICQNQTVDCTR